MNQSERQVYLIRELLKEMPQYGNMRIPEDEEEQWQLLRSLFNVRPPKAASADFLRVQDEYLSEKIRLRGIVDSACLAPVKADNRIFLWQGDITTLACDAIVNAANSALLGCWQPCHSCIDNIIHTLSGVQLRIRCNEIMQAQGHEEETGKAKITPGYNLPARYVLHTVGPIISAGNEPGGRARTSVLRLPRESNSLQGNWTVGYLRKKDCELLAGCYRSCLELAAANGLKSIAFCCISTGVFAFPQEKAAQIAVETVSDFLKTDSSIRQVIFNVFTDKDLAIYRNLLKC